MLTASVFLIQVGTGASEVRMAAYTLALSVSSRRTNVSCLMASTSIASSMLSASVMADINRLRVVFVLCVCACVCMCVY
jgi:hypothetical protein